ncbi:Uncharacterised protein [Pannonibacter phragmitetus]|uniref:Integrase catalytic domain-containing protein n=1 Tax=Pannonibacter phragmitetus TaxID=121719 RepID=A0A378ZUA2_9HYPH|nr:Uncharacterised protein [Pannonibacter phragmitetus]
MNRKPIQNGFIESFNERLRDELLNETLFSSLSHARAVLAIWQADYNGARPRSQLCWQPPDEFAATLNPRPALARRNTKSSAPLPTTSQAHQAKNQSRERTQNWMKLGGKVTSKLTRTPQVSRLARVWFSSADGSRVSR